MSTEGKMILKELKARPDMASVNEEFLLTAIADAISDVKDMINYSEDEELPKGLYGIVKKIVCAEVGRAGYVGVNSYSFSGVSINFSNPLDEKDKKKIRHYRRFPNGSD